MNIVESSLKLKDLYFKELHFLQQKKINTALRYLFDYDVYYNDEEHNDFNLKIKIEMEDEEKNIAIKAIAMASFIYEGDQTAEIKDVIINENSVAIVFPYIRAQITILTAQPGINPVMFPIMNIGETIKRQKEFDSKRKETIKKIDKIVESKE